MRRRGGSRDGPGGDRALAGRHGCGCLGPAAGRRASLEVRPDVARPTVSDRARRIDAPWRSREGSADMETFGRGRSPCSETSPTMPPGTLAMAFRHVCSHLKE